jgi:hypothetical protein
VIKVVKRSWAEDYVSGLMLFWLPTIAPAPLLWYSLKAYTRGKCMIKIQYLDKGAETGRELLCVCMRDVSESLYKRGRHDQDSIFR